MTLLDNFIVKMFGETFSILFGIRHNSCYFYLQLLEQHQEHVKATEMLVSKERERLEVLENAVKQREAALLEKHQNLVSLN